MYQGLIEKYFDVLPLKRRAPCISLQEGRTPLLKLQHVPRKLPIPLEIYVKLEGLNPTASFKDRGMTVAITEALQQGSKAVICASTGNTSASAAAYAARAGMKAFVVIPRGKIALGKMVQAAAAGAKILKIDGNFDQGMDLVKTLVKTCPVTLVNSVNPYRLQGQKTAALEIIEDLGRMPDYHCLPVGNAGNISAYWMGYAESCGLDNGCTYQARRVLGSAYKRAPKIASPKHAPPIMVGYQASGAASMVLGKTIEKPETLATAIRIGNPQNRNLANIASTESNGWFGACTDDEILEGYRMLAKEEGVFCEPSSAISVMGLVLDVHKGRFRPNSVVVCTLTGHGLKDPEIVESHITCDTLEIEPKLGALAKVIEDHLS